MTAAESKVAFSVHNIVGAVGTLACGWATSKIFKGRCAPMNVICMFFCLLGVLLYWMVGSGMIAASPALQKTLIYIALCLIGFFIYGPVALTGVQALNLVLRTPPEQPPVSWVCSATFLVTPSAPRSLWAASLSAAHGTPPCSPSQ